MLRSIVCGVAFVMVMASDSLAQLGPPDNRITVIGEGVVAATPDVFLLDFAVTLEGADLEKIHADVSQRCGQVVKAAREFKLDPARTFTREYQITPRNDLNQKFVGYRVSQKFRFALAELDQAEALTTAVLKAGATTIESVEFTVADSEELWETAREKAVAKALTRATRMTKMVNSKPGAATNISDQGNQFSSTGCSWNPKALEKTDGAGLPEGDRVFFVPPTSVKFQVRVSVSFSIEPL